jgi:uncharacterized protein
MSMIKAEILVKSTAAKGIALALQAPISFWGGVHPQTGIITDVRHPDCGTSISGRVLCLPGTIGSSSAAAILLELVYARKAPAALILHEPDAILLLGLIVAREMDYTIPPAYQLDRSHFSHLDQNSLEIDQEGNISVSVRSEYA